MSLGRTLAREFSSAPILVLDEVASTLDEARRRAAASDEPCWIVALKQTQGRGRRGREWQAPAGNLSLTGYAFHQGPIAALPQLSFVAAMAAYDCAASFCSHASDAAKLSLNPFEAMTTVTVKIVSQLTGDTEFASPETLVAFALGLTLFVLTLGLNIIALVIVRKYREQYE